MTWVVRWSLSNPTTPNPSNGWSLDGRPTGMTAVVYDCGRTALGGDNASIAAVISEVRSEMNVAISFQLVGKKRCGRNAGIFEISPRRDCHRRSRGGISANGLQAGSLWLRSKSQLPATASFTTALSAVVKTTIVTSRALERAAVHCHKSQRNREQDHCQQEDPQTDGGLLGAANAFSTRCQQGPFVRIGED